MSFSCADLAFCESLFKRETILAEDLAGNLLPSWRKDQLEGYLPLPQKRINTLEEAHSPASRKAPPKVEDAALLVNGKLFRRSSAEELQHWSGLQPEDVVWGSSRPVWLCYASRPAPVTIAT